jgi:hypothetical protein
MVIRMSEPVNEFFSRYDRANSSSDVASIGDMYADTFMFAGPNGVQTVKRDDFLKFIPKMKAHLLSIGLLETQLHGIQENPISSSYLLAKVNWKMRIRSPRNDVWVDAFATYILAISQRGELSIVFQIDHQDLAALVVALQNVQVEN